MRGVHRLPVRHGSRAGRGQRGAAKDGAVLQNPVREPDGVASVSNVRRFNRCANSVSCRPKTMEFGGAKTAAVSASTSRRASWESSVPRKTLHAGRTGRQEQKVPAVRKKRRIAMTHLRHYPRRRLGRATFERHARDGRGIRRGEQEHAVGIARQAEPAGTDGQHARGSTIHLDFLQRLPVNEQNRSAVGRPCHAAAQTFGAWKEDGRPLFRMVEARAGSSFRRPVGNCAPVGRDPERRRCPWKRRSEDASAASIGAGRRFSAVAADTAAKPASPASQSSRSRRLTLSAHSMRAALAPTALDLQPRRRCRSRRSRSRHRRSSRIADGVEAGSAAQSGSVLSTSASVSDTSSPRNRRRPLSISYSTTPNAQMSARLSTGLPLACSGAM